MTRVSSNMAPPPGDPTPNDARLAKGTAGAPFSTVLSALAAAGDARAGFADTLQGGEGAAADARQDDRSGASRRNGARSDPAATGTGEAVAPAADPSAILVLAQAAMTPSSGAPLADARPSPAPALVVRGDRPEHAAAKAEVRRVSRQLGPASETSAPGDGAMTPLSGRVTEPAAIGGNGSSDKRPATPAPAAPLDTSVVAPVTAGGMAPASRAAPAGHATSGDPPAAPSAAAQRRTVSSGVPPELLASSQAEIGAAAMPRIIAAPATASGDDEDDGTTASPVPTSPARDAAVLPVRPGAAPTVGMAAASGAPALQADAGSTAGSESAFTQGRQQDREASAVLTVRVAEAHEPDQPDRDVPSPATPTAQVLGLLKSIVADAQAASPEAASAPATPNTPAAVPARAPNAVVTLELNPVALGRVTVTLRMKGNAVAVRIAVSSRDTLSVLAEDRHRLAEALGSGETTVDLDDAPPDPQGPAGSASAILDGRTPEGGRPATPDAGSGQGGGRAGARGPDRPSSRAGHDDASAASAPRTEDRRDGSLYL